MIKVKHLRVDTVQEFVKVLSAIPTKPGHMRFFRGHADMKRFKLKPSIYRSSVLAKNEHDLIQEAILRCPADFPPESTFFEKLVRLQHYGLPTRLLDLTANALTALWFACCEKERTVGEVVVLDIPHKSIKYYNSDTVAVISNLARRPFAFDLNTMADDFEEFNEEEEIGRLIHDIGEDKPAFRPLVKKEDLERVICVRAKLDNARIARQDGAFLLFGIEDEKRSPAKIPLDWITCGSLRRIVFSHKHRIKTQLEQFGVSARTLFPELDHQTRFIVAKFKGRYKHRKLGKAKRLPKHKTIAIPKGALSGL